MSSRPILQVKDAGRGVTPDCPAALFKRGDVVAISRRKAMWLFPAEAVVAAAVPPGFAPEYALADLVGEPRPLMVSQGRKAITYILVNEGDPKPYLAQERDLRPSGKPPVEIGAVRREGRSPADPAA